MVRTKSKPRLLQVHLATTDYQIREEQVRDKTYWVLPVVMMVEGVHHGSRGPILYTEEELAASSSEWEGIPVTIGHPKDEKGKYISANAPSVLKGIVGRIYNAKMKGDKLTAEVWVEMDALAQVSEEALEYIKEKKALDVSVGVFSRETAEEGEFNGEIYRAQAIGIIPDHLALLPGEKGACGWDDGCGIRNNEDMKNKQKQIHLTAMLESGQGIFLIDNKASLNQIVSSMYDHLNSMDSDTQAFYMEEIYDNYVVYAVIDRNTRQKSLYKREYTMSADGKIEFTGEATSVVKKVTYASIQPKGSHNVSLNNNSKMKRKPCTCTVDSLISNENTEFTEEDRAWLEKIPQDQLNKLAPQEAEPTKPTVNNDGKEKKGESLITRNADGTISIDGKSMQDFIKESFGKESDPIKFIDNFMPDGMKDQMKSGLRMYQNRRDSQIKAIAANSKFKPEQLKNWSDEDLEVLHSSVVPADEVGANYAPFGGGSVEDEEEEDISADAISAMLSFATKPKAEPEKK